MAEVYLVDLRGREQEGVRRLLSLPFLAGELFGPLGLDAGFAWYLLEMRMDRLSELRGDIDVLAGRLAWRDQNAFESLIANEAKDKPDYHPSWHINNAALKLIAEGGLRWPPPTDYLVGVEAKCSYLARGTKEISEDTVKSRKSSQQRLRHLQGQLGKLLKMGFDRVGLLDMIATPPSSGNGIHAWFAASYTAFQSWSAMSATLGKRLPAGTPTGHWVWPIGSIVGGDESQRGAGVPQKLKGAEENPFLYDDVKVKRRRQTVQENLQSVLEKLPPPRNMPVILVDCRHCCETHGLTEPCAVLTRRPGCSEGG